MKMDAAMEEATRAELERLELLLMDPAVRRDRQRVAALLAGDFMEFGSSGRVWTREAILELLATETYTPPGVGAFACRMMSDDVVLVTYHAARTDAATGERTVTLRSSIWTRVNGNWQMRFHQGTRAN
ncbi:MAG: DUF4440 domain-containing protein [Terracidiphilus sp.]